VPPRGQGKPESASFPSGFLIPGRKTPCDESWVVSQAHLVQNQWRATRCVRQVSNLRAETDWPPTTRRASWGGSCREAARATHKGPSGVQ